MTALRIFAGLLLFIGCGARTPLGQATPSDSDASTAGTFHGKFELHYFPDYGEVIAPKDLSTSIVQLYTNDGVIAGVGKSDGTFQIANASAIGPYTVRVDDEMVVGAADGVTLVQNLPGRPNRLRSPWPFGPPTLDLTLDGLAPMPPLKEGPISFNGAWMILGSAVAGCDLYSAEQQWQPTPSAGTISVSDAIAQTNGSEPGCRMELGDQPFLLQIVNPLPTDPFPRVTTIRELDLPGFSTQDALPIKVTGTLHTVPLAQLQIDFRPSSYFPALFVAGAAKPTAHMALAERPTSSKYARPWINVGNYSDQPDGPFVASYPNVFPAWTKTLLIDASTILDLQVPGSTKTISAAMTINGEVDVTASSMGPIAISLSPPRNVLVGAAPAFAPVTDAGTTPTIRWDKPDYQPVGLLRYAVEITDVSPTPGPTIPTIWTLERLVVVPSGFLEKGHLYVAKVVVYWTQDMIDFALHPLDGELRETASTPSGVFTP